MLINWDYIYDYLGIKDFVYFISSPSIQDAVFPVKIVFICFTIFFLIAIVWFYANSSYIKYKFLQDATEFITKDAYGLRKVSRDWKKIKKRVDTRIESELKLAVIEADDLLYQTLQDMDYKGDTFEELVGEASKKIHNTQEIIQGHQVRNSIVYDQNYKLTSEGAGAIVSRFEQAAKNLSLSA